MTIRSTLESNQPHMPYGNEKGVRPDALRIPLRLNDAPEEKPMRHDSLTMDSRINARICQIARPKTPFRVYNKSSQKSETALGVDAPNAASVTDSRRRATMHNANHTISPDNRIDDPAPDFEPRQIIDAAPLPLSFSLPLLSPTGERCQIILVGSPAQWGELMTALVRAGWDYAPPVAWTDGGAS